MGVLMFLFWDFVFEFLEDLFNVSLPSDLEGAFGVVPFEGHTYVLFGLGPVLGVAKKGRKLKI